MHGRKGSKVFASCPSCRHHISHRAAGSRKEAWIECPRCGQVFEAMAKKSKQYARAYEFEDEEYELNLIYR